MLTRDEMKAVVHSGRSVFYKGRIITSEAELPSAAELAMGDPVAEAATAAELQAQITQLHQQLATLTAGSSTTPDPASSAMEANDQATDDTTKPKRK